MSANEGRRRQEGPRAHVPVRLHRVRHRLEAVQKFSDDALTECPACGGKLRKVFSAVGVVFKGSGFYRTDSRGKSSASRRVCEVHLVG